MTSKIYEHTKTIGSYAIANDLPLVDLSRAATHDFVSREDVHHRFRVSVVDSVDEYLQLLKTVFDFASLKALFARRDFVFAFDGLHGVSGPYAQR